MTRFKLINRWIARPLSNLHTFLLILLIGVFLVGNILKINQVITWCYPAGLILMLEFTAHWNLHQLYLLINIHQEMDEFPAAQMSLINRALLGFFLIASVMAGALVYFLPLDQFLGRIWGFFWNYLLKPLLRFLVSLLSGEPAAEVIGQETPAASGGMPPMDPSVTPAWLEFVMRLLEIAAFIGLSVLLLYGAGRLIYHLYCRFANRTRYSGDLRETLTPSWKQEKAKKKLKNLAEHFSWMDRSPNGRIRSLYRRQVKLHYQKLQQSSPLPHLTPEELEYESRMHEADRAKDLHTLYEKARYGNVPCTKEEVRSMYQKESIS